MSDARIVKKQLLDLLPSFREHWQAHVLPTEQRDIYEVQIGAFFDELADYLYQLLQLGNTERFSEIASSIESMLAENNKAAYPIYAGDLLNKLSAFCHQDEDIFLAFGDFLGPLGFSAWEQTRFQKAQGA